MLCAANGSAAQFYCTLLLSFHGNIAAAPSSLHVWAHVMFFESLEIISIWKFLGKKCYQLKEITFSRQVQYFPSSKKERQTEEADRFKGPSAVVFNSSKFAWVESEGSICHMDGSASIISQLWPQWNQWDTLRNFLHFSLLKFFSVQKAHDKTGDF